MNIVIMCYVHHLGTEKEGKNLQIVPKSTPTDTNWDYHKLQDVKE